MRAVAVLHKDEWSSRRGRSADGRTLLQGNPGQGRRLWQRPVKFELNASFKSDVSGQSLSQLELHILLVQLQVIQAEAAYLKHQRPHSLMVSQSAAPQSGR